MLARMRSFWQGLFRRSKVEQDLEQELQTHIAERSDALERSGLTREAAVRMARLEFGTVESYKERCREARGLRWPDELMQDVRYALRMARRSPGVTAVAVLSLALGIGANTGIFSILNSLLLTTLPVHDPARLVILQTWRGQVPGAASYPLFLRLREGLRSKVLEDVCAATGPDAASVSLPGADRIKAVQNSVSSNYFDVLGVPLIEGHSFGAAEEKIHSAAVAVIGERFWKNRLGSDPAIIGKILLVDDRPTTVIGIARGDFFGIEIGTHVDVWTNLTASDPERLTAGWNFLSILGRLKPDGTSGQAKAALHTVYENYRREQLAALPNFKRDRQMAQEVHMTVESGATGISKLRQRFSLPLRIAMGVVALVLLIACANITNLLLARAAARQREIATRLSLGAGSARLFRQFLTESLLLSGCGGLLGLAVAVWTSRHLMDLIPPGEVPLALDVHLSLRVLLFTSAIAIGAGLLSGIVPAMRVGRSHLVAALKFTAASDFGGARGRIRPGKLLSVAQLALSTLLIFGAGLFVKTLLNLRNVDSGFRTAHVLTFALEIPRGAVTPEQKQETMRRLVERLKDMPGTTGATVSWPGPFNGGRFTGSVKIPGVEIPEDLKHDVDYMLIGSDYFQVMGTRLLAGRGIDTRDTSKSHITAAIINESMARTYFSGKNPVGMKLQPFPRAKEPSIAEIVGMVPDIRHFGLRESGTPTVYFPITEMDPPWAPTFEVRYSKDLTSASRDIERAVAQVDPRLHALDIQTMDQQINAYLEKERMLATIASLFGSIALLLAAVGLYGVMAYAVTRRTKEIGLRLALGARRRQVLDMILVDGAVIAVAGVALGVPAALALSRFLSSLLFDVKPSDLGSLAAPLAIMLGVATLAVLLPAWRAMRVDPMGALRDE